MKNKERAQDFFEGRLTPGEAKEYLEWLMSESADHGLNEEIQAIWNEKYQDSHKEFDTAKALAEIKQKISAPEKSRSLRLLKHWPLKVAAVLSLIVISTVLILQNQKNSIQDQKGHWVTKQNPAGQKSKIHLSDGSFVTLNANSSISYPQNFVNNRTIKLVGEAFFEVKKNPEAPFKVISKEVTTTALGTSFNVRAYENSSIIEILLATGKVVVNDTISKQEMYLNPGQGIKKNLANPSLQIFETDRPNIAAWTRGILHFNATPLNDVITDLENWYGVQIDIEGKSDTILCSGTFDNEYLDNVLDVLSHSVGFEFQINDKEVTIKF